MNPDPIEAALESLDHLVVDLTRAEAASARSILQHMAAKVLRKAATDLAKTLYACHFDHGAEPYGEVVSRPVQAVTVDALLERAKEIEET